MALIDFSHNLYVALCFACNGDFEEDGEVVMLKTDDFKTINDIDYDKKEQDIRIINPAPTHPSRARVLAQSSVFVVAPAGYIEEDKCKRFTIEAKHKAKMLRHLESFHNIDTHTIYNDLIGFIVNEENNTKAEGKVYKGLAKQKEEKPKEAIICYTEAIKRNPQDAEAYYKRGIAKSELGEYEEAIKDYDKALALNPQDAIAYNNRGLAKLALKEYEEAIKDYDEALALNPQYAKAYYHRGNVKSELKKYKEAIKDYDEALALNPKYADAYYNRGNVKSASKKYEEAIKDYDEAIALNPQDAMAYNNREI